jgi:7-carboxy-7-deazaguanine synthase
MDKLNVYSIFHSIQGESTYAGLPCVFIRLSGCSLNCVYCDTKEACRIINERLPIKDIIKRVEGFNCPLVEVTGGEPLEQKATLKLLKALAEREFKVLLETNGAHPVLNIDERVMVVMDIKTPGSLMSEFIYEPNLTGLNRKRQQIKFVITGRDDFDFAVKMTRKYRLSHQTDVLISNVSELDRAEVAEWILQSGLPFRYQVQLHKVIWPDAEEEV